MFGSKQRTHSFLLFPLPYTRQILMVLKGEEIPHLQLVGTIVTDSFVTIRIFCSPSTTRWTLVRGSSSDHLFVLSPLLLILVSWLTSYFVSMYNVLFGVFCRCYINKSVNRKSWSESFLFIACILLPFIYYLCMLLSPFISLAYNILESDTTFLPMTYPTYNIITLIKSSGYP